MPGRVDDKISERFVRVILLFHFSFHHFQRNETLNDFPGDLGNAATDVVEIQGLELALTDHDGIKADNQNENTADGSHRHMDTIRWFWPSSL